MVAIGADIGGNPQWDPNKSQEIINHAAVRSRRS
jgi:hypothetical protein